MNDHGNLPITNQMTPQPFPVEAASLHDNLESLLGPSETEHDVVYGSSFLNPQVTMKYNKYENVHSQDWFDFMNPTKGQGQPPAARAKRTGSPCEAPTTKISRQKPSLLHVYNQKTITCNGPLLLNASHFTSAPAEVPRHQLILDHQVPWSNSPDSSIISEPSSECQSECGEAGLLVCCDEIVCCEKEDCTGEERCEDLGWHHDSVDQTTDRWFPMNAVDQDDFQFQYKQHPMSHGEQEAVEALTAIGSKGSLPNLPGASMTATSNQDIFDMSTHVENSCFVSRLENTKLPTDEYMGKTHDTMTLPPAWPPTQLDAQNSYFTTHNLCMLTPLEQLGPLGPLGTEGSTSHIKTDDSFRESFFANGLQSNPHEFQKCVGTHFNLYGFSTTPLDDDLILNASQIHPPAVHHQIASQFEFNNPEPLLGGNVTAPSALKRTSTPATMSNVSRHSSPSRVKSSESSSPSKHATPFHFDGVTATAPCVEEKVPDFCCLWRSEDQPTVCGCSFTNADDLHIHLKDVHIMSTKSDAGYRCNWKGCLRKAPFNQKSKLERHIQAHTRYKPVKCPICGVALSAKQALDQHMRTHTGEKPFKCTFAGCSHAFKQQSALTMHMRTHTGLKPLKCDICHKTFGESSNLSKHRRTHNEKGEYICGLCGKDFNRRDQLRQHLTRCHKDMPDEVARLLDLCTQKEGLRKTSLP